jgi:hypothetical protein
MKPDGIAAAMQLKSDVACLHYREIINDDGRPCAQIASSHMPVQLRDHDHSPWLNSRSNPTVA